MPIAYELAADTYYGLGVVTVRISGHCLMTMERCAHITGKKKVSAVVVDNNYMHTCESQVSSFMALGMGGRCLNTIQNGR